MTRHRRLPGESCGNCISFERGEPERNDDMTIKIEKNPLGACWCGPPHATVLPMPNGKRIEFTEVTGFPPSRRADDHCQHYEPDPAKVAVIPPTK